MGEKKPRVIGYSKAAVEQNSRKCKREGPAWQTASFSARSPVILGPNDFYLASAGTAGRFASPDQHQFPKAMARPSMWAVILLGCVVRSVPAPVRLS